MRSEAATSEPMKLPPTTRILRASGASLRERDGIGEGAEGLHGRKIATRDGELPRVRTACDHERPVRDRLAACELHGVGSGVDGLDPGVEAQLDDEVVVLLGLVHECGVRLHLPAQHALRERRPVVRRRLVGGEDRDQRLAACLTVGVDEAGGRAAAADDQDRVLRLRHRLPVYPARPARQTAATRAPTPRAGRTAPRGARPRRP